MTSPTDGRTVEHLIHLMSNADWDAVRHESELRPSSLADVGFIHLSTPQQVHLPANRFYSGEHDLLALHVEPTRLDAEIRWEPGVAGDPESMLFPHLYGPLPLSAVVDVTSYPQQADGTFAPFDESGT